MVDQKVYLFNQMVREIGPKEVLWHNSIDN